MPYRSVLYGTALTDKGINKMNRKIYNAVTNRLRYKRRRQRFFELYVKHKGCRDCNIKYKNYLVYEFDHINGIKRSDRKIKDITTAFKGSLKKLFKELRTGEYVCANCHKIRTYSNKQHKKLKYI